MEEARRDCLKQGDCDALQIIFNIFRQKPIDELFAEGEGERRRDYRAPAAGERAVGREI